MKTRIKELRREKHFTQTQLAELIGANQTMLSKIETGASTPDAMLLIELSRLFKVSTDYILYLSDERMNADFLLEDNMHNLKKYQRLISLYQKMNNQQQGSFYDFLGSLFDSSNEL
ncbi:MAG: helix-turn-helix domain-containing protein [Bacillus sp. (in: Bacteria)]|nr:helix-turn-helix domain-containing protein [Bacillus sp. (in: firmicutes)]MCM1427439.1 helix-turn-helix domain-containing protein [Eubacterium sp.]